VEDKPQYFKNPLTSVGIGGVCCSRTVQCCLQKALPGTGELVHTSGRDNAGIWLTMYCKRVLIMHAWHMILSI